MADFKFEFIQPELPIWANVFAITANILNLIYNFPQMWLTYKRKTTRDISGYFLSLRIISSIIWIIYSFEIDNGQLIIANTVTLLSSLFICYYKMNEIIGDLKNREKNNLNDKKDNFSIIPLDKNSDANVSMAILRNDELK